MDVLEIEWNKKCTECLLSININTSKLYIKSFVTVPSMDMMENTAQNSSVEEIIDKIPKQQVYVLHLKI